jgi:alpha-glucosidase
MLNQLLLALATCASLADAVPFPHVGVPLDVTSITALRTRDADPNACPGYAASNVVKTDSSLTADLTLAGAACNVYSDDIKDLKLVVEYQTSKCSFMRTTKLLRVMKLMVHRRASSRQDL